MTSVPRIVRHDHRIGEADIMALRALVGQSPRHAGCSHLSADLGNRGLLSTPSLALQLGGVFPPVWIEITARPEERECRVLHVPAASRTTQPESFAVTAGPNGSWTIAGHSLVRLGDRGVIEAIDILALTETFEGEQDGEGFYTEIVSYDCALILRFSGGPALSLSTTAPGEFARALIEIRPSDEIAPLQADDIVETRITLN